MRPVSDPQNVQTTPVETGSARQPRSHDGARAVPVPLVVERRFVVADGATDERIAVIAGAQEGRVARWQLLMAAVTDAQIRWRLRRRLLTSMLSGVYAYGHAAETQHSTEIAALLTRGTDALICAHRAAGMYGFRPMCSGVDLLVPDSQGGGHREDIRIHRTGDPTRLEPDFIDGVPVVAPAWVLLEIAADLSARTLEAALDEAFSIGRVNRDEVRRVVEANPTRAGAGLLRELVNQRLVGNPSRSHGQERLLALVRRAGLPDPEMDARIGCGFTADLFWRKAGVAAEYDSYQWHSKRAAWARDRRKDRHCEAEGIALVRAIDEDMMGDEALQLVANLAGLIAGRSQDRGGRSQDRG
jgi:hypothetical protein